MLPHVIADLGRQVGRTDWTATNPEQRKSVAIRCASLTDAIYPGLNLSCEIDAVARLSLGDTIILGDAAQLDGFAVCHCGPQTEAGTGTCYVKFAAALPSAHCEAAFTRLVASCEGFAAQRGCERIVCGVNYGRVGTLELLAGRGYRTQSLGVTMHGANAPGYSEPGKWVIDDWR
jgi:hypothetical protein